MTLLVGTRENPIRQSTIKSWFVCERQGQYAAERVERESVGAKAWLGTIEHRVVELMHQADRRVELFEIEGLLKYARLETIGEAQEEISPEQQQEILEGEEKQLEHLTNYLDLGWFDFHHAGLIGVEIPWRAKLGRWWCKGTIDLLHQPTPGFLRMVDLKTGIPSNPHSRGIDLQMPLYSLAVERGELLIGGEWVTIGTLPHVCTLFESPRLERYKRNGRRGHLRWFAGDLKSDPEAEVLVGPGELDRVEAIVDEMGARMNGYYTRGPHRLQTLRTGVVYGACHQCGYRRRCGVHIPGSYHTDQDMVETFGRVFGGTDSLAVQEATA